MTLTKWSKHKGIWVLVADSAYARVFRYERANRELIEISHKRSNQTEQLAKELSEPPSGRVFDRVGGGRHVVTRRLEAEEKVERKFIKEVVRDVEKLARQKNFDHLVIIAAPRTLGHIRQYLDKDLKEHIVDEFPLDLVHLPIQELSGYVHELLEP